MDTQKKYWFPAKKFGWGWSFPTCWQGWAVFIAYAASLLLLHHFLSLASEQPAYLAGVGVFTIALLAICWFKGEPPGSHSGR
jgi:hypothetical protein